MLFKRELAEKIKASLKTQTRRIKKPGEGLTSYPDGRKVVVVGALPGVSRHIKWVVGKTYAIQPGRGRKAIGRFRLLDIRQEGVAEIGESDAIAEGVDLNHYYCDVGVSPDYFPVHRCDPVGEFSRLWDSIYTAPGTRWQDNPKVWVLVFEYVEDNQ